MTGRRAGQLCSTTHIDCELVIPVDHSASTLETHKILAWIWPLEKTDHILWACQVGCMFTFAQFEGRLYYILYVMIWELFFFAFNFVSLCLPSPGVNEWCGHWYLSGHAGGLQLAIASLYQGSGVNEFFCGWNDVPNLPLVSFKCHEIWNQRTWEMPCLIPSLMSKLHFHCHRFQKRWDNLVLCRDVGE